MLYKHMLVLLLQVHHKLKLVYLNLKPSFFMLNTSEIPRVFLLIQNSEEVIAKIFTKMNSKFFGPKTQWIVALFGAITVVESIEFEIITHRFKDEMSVLLKFNIKRWFSITAKNNNKISRTLREKDFNHFRNKMKKMMKELIYILAQRFFFLLACFNFRIHNRRFYEVNPCISILKI